MCEETPLSEQSSKADEVDGLRSARLALRQ